MDSPCQFCLMLPATGRMSCCHSAEVRAENKRLQEALEPFAALLDPEEDWGAITIVDIGVRIEDVRQARDLLVAQAQQKAPPGGGAGGAGC